MAKKSLPPKKNVSSQKPVAKKKPLKKPKAKQAKLPVLGGGMFGGLGASGAQGGMV